jgi:peptidoglycan/xylan/chitin deacetylase (PgdA/CDA1 family)
MKRLAVTLLLLLGACAPVIEEAVVGRSDDFVVVRARSGDTLAGLAERYLGGADKAWMIADFNDSSRVVVGQEIAIPLKSFNTTGVEATGYQTVPVLTYHRFRAGDRVTSQLEVSEAAFRQQMRYLREHDYRVIHLSDLREFMAGLRQLPKRAVAVSIDDGYRNVYEIAWPIIRQYRIPTTLFVYSDFLNTGGGLTWAQLREMTKSGLVDVQPHSKSHGNLRDRGSLSDDGYRRMLKEEVSQPAELIRRQLGIDVHSFGYPYGAANEQVIGELQRGGYALAFTVRRGGNPAYSPAFVLRRSQIYGSDDIGVFARRLEVYREVSLR